MTFVPEKGGRRIWRWLELALQRETRNMIESYTHLATIPTRRSSFLSKVRPLRLSLLNMNIERKQKKISFFKLKEKLMWIVIKTHTMVWCGCPAHACWVFISIWCKWRRDKPSKVAKTSKNFTEPQILLTSIFVRKTTYHAGFLSTFMPSVIVLKKEGRRTLFWRF